MQQFTGLEYLKIDIANHAGKDRELFADRLRWVDEFESDLEDLVDIADKPFQYLAAVMAYRDTQKGLPTGHLVGFDSCASGLQIMAALSGCRTTARNTGLIGQKRMDMYSECTSAMAGILGTKVDIPRKAVKSAQMPFFYGSDQKPKEVFGEGTEEYYAFHKANMTVAPGGCELRQLLLDSWQDNALDHSWVLPDGFHAYCPTMVKKDTVIEVDELDHASFVYQHRVNAGIVKGEQGSKSIAANPIHAVDGQINREMCRRCNYDKTRLEEVRDLIIDQLAGKQYLCSTAPVIEKLWQASGFLSLVAVEHIWVDTIWEFSHDYLREVLALIEKTLGRKSFPLITIHDEFKAHANNVNVVRQTYIDIMAEIADSTMLEFLISQILGKPTPVKKYSTDLGDLIREAEYPLS